MSGCAHDGGEPCPPRTPGCDCRARARIGDRVLRSEFDAVVAERDRLTREVADLRANLGTCYGALRVNEKAWQKLAPAGGSVEIAAQATAVALEVAREALREPDPKETT